MELGIHTNVQLGITDGIWYTCTLHLRIRSELGTHVTGKVQNSVWN